MESVTLPVVWAWVMGGASAVVLLVNAAKSIASAVHAVKAPNAKQDKRIEEIESWKTEVNSELDRCKHSMESIQDGNHAIYKALLALLDHGIDGNNIKQMQDAKSELYDHLTNH